MKSVPEELRALKARRETNERREKEWADDVVAVLRRCREEGHAITEAADALGLERSTLYRVYLPRLDGEAEPDTRAA